MRFPHNISRIEAFSDAVFAFAATLLVVSLGTDSTDAIIDIDVKLFTGFAVSFFVLVILWFLHYNFFRRTNYMDNVIIAINPKIIGLGGIVNYKLAKIRHNITVNFGTLYYIEPFTIPKSIKKSSSENRYH